MPSCTVSQGVEKKEESDVIKELNKLRKEQMTSIGGKKERKEDEDRGRNRKKRFLNDL